MPSIDMITTTAGRAAILAALASSATITLSDAQISDADESVTMATTALGSVVATLEAVGTVRAAGDGYALHVVLKDDSTAAYDLRSLALRLEDGTFLMAYSQADAIASKGAASSLHIALDLTIDADTAATITFGDTDYTLPAASETAPGLIEVATMAEFLAGTDGARAVTPFQATGAINRAHCYVALANMETRTPAGSFLGAFYGVAASSDLLVAVGDNGEIQTSPDGETWTHQDADASFAGTFGAVAFDGSLWVAAGASGEIQTSTAPTIGWTHRAAAASYSGSFFDVCGNGSLWVAVGTSAEIQTSPDGENWTHQSKAGSFANHFRGVAYGAGLWVIVGDDGEIQTSPDGVNWTHRASGLSVDLWGVTYGPDGFVAAGDQYALFSADGIAWTSHNEPSAAGNTSSSKVAYGGGCYVAAGTEFWLMSYGAGREFVPNEAGSINDICFFKRRFIAVGGTGAIAASLRV